MSKNKKKLYKKISQERAVVHVSRRQIILGKCLQHAYANLMVWIVKDIAFRELVELLNREISALAQQWQCYRVSSNFCHILTFF